MRPYNFIMRRALNRGHLRIPMKVHMQLTRIAGEGNYKLVVEGVEHPLAKAGTLKQINGCSAARPEHVLYIVCVK